jgi:hypothetical protein
MAPTDFSAIPWRNVSAVFALEAVRIFDDNRGRWGDVAREPFTSPTVPGRSGCAPGSLPNRGIADRSPVRRLPMTNRDKPGHLFLTPDATSPCENPIALSTGDRVAWA